MKYLKIVLLSTMTVALIFSFAYAAGNVEKEKAAGWDKCKGCHTDAGKPAPSKADLLKKFKTEKELIAAAKKSKNPMMSNFKKDDLLKAAAKDLGLK
jgi:Skp family chaperone for outer membrane proteins